MPIQRLGDIVLLSPARPFPPPPSSLSARHTQTSPPPSSFLRGPSPTLGSLSPPPSPRALSLAGSSRACLPGCAWIFPPSPKMPWMILSGQLSQSATQGIAGSSKAEVRHGGCGEAGRPSATPPGNGAGREAEQAAGGAKRRRGRDEASSVLPSPPVSPPQRGLGLAGKEGGGRRLRRRHLGAGRDCGRNRKGRGREARRETWTHRGDGCFQGLRGRRRRVGRRRHQLALLFLGHGV